MNKQQKIVAIAAIKKLLCIYKNQLLLRCGSRHFNFSCEDEFRQELKRYVAELREAQRSLSEGRKALIESGFPVPDQWLTVNPLPTMTAGRRACDDDRIVFFMDESAPDWPAVEHVAGDMLASLMRLAHSPCDETSSPEPTADYVTHAVAVAMLNNVQGLTAKEHSKLMARLRENHGDNLRCEKRGNMWCYHPDDMKRVAAVYNAQKPSRRTSRE